MPTQTTKEITVTGSAPKKRTAMSSHKPKKVFGKEVKSGGSSGKKPIKFDPNFGARSVAGPSVHGCMSSYDDGDDGHHDGDRSGY